MNNSENVQALPALPEEELENLGPGCYVKVCKGSCCYWAEITENKGENFAAVVHHELDKTNCPESQNEKVVSVFSKKQIVDLGCDNYCWC